MAKSAIRYLTFLSDVILKYPSCSSRWLIWNRLLTKILRVFLFSFLQNPLQFTTKKVSMPYTEHRHVASEDKWHIIHTDGRQAIWRIWIWSFKEIARELPDFGRPWTNILGRCCPWSCLRAAQTASTASASAYMIITTRLLSHHK